MRWWWRGLRHPGRLWLALRVRVPTKEMRAWCSGELELERAGAKSKRKKEESRRRARVRRARHEASSGIERQSCASAQHKGAAGNRAELRPSVRGGGQGAEGGRAARGAGWRLAGAETGADQAACGGAGGMPMGRCQLARPGEPARAYPSKPAFPHHPRSTAPQLSSHVQDCSPHRYSPGLPPRRRARRPPFPSPHPRL